MQDLQEDNLELERVIEQLKDENYNQGNAGKMMTDYESQNLKNILRETEQRFRDLEEENRRLRNDASKKDQYQSAFQSNQRAIIDKVEILERESKEKDELVRKYKYDYQSIKDENERLIEELNINKGRMGNLQRDIEMTSTAMSKMNCDQGTMESQVNLYKNRISEMEEEMARVREDKTQLQFEIRKLEMGNERLQEDIKRMNSDAFRKQSESQSSSATVTRL